MHKETWPVYDRNKIQISELVLAVQVNGKVRGELTVAQDISEADVIEQAKKDENVKKYLEGKEIKKSIYVKGKLVSLVV